MSLVHDARENLFYRLMPQTGSAESKERVDGHEAWLTQALAAVLQQNAMATRRLLAEWCGVELGPDEIPVIRAEWPYQLQERQAVPDLVIETSQALIFIENKLGARLNRYVTIVDGEPTDHDQLDLYARALREHRGRRRAHLVALARVRYAGPADVSDEGRLWGDLYAILRDTLGEASSSHGDWLTRQFVEFMEIVHLDPSQPLRLPVPRDVDVQRLLVLAADRLPAEWRTATVGAFLVPLPDHGASLHTVSIGASGLTVFRSGAGCVDVGTLPPEFWSDTDAAKQADRLAAMLADLPSAQLAPGARVPEGLLFERFGAYSGIARRVAERAETRWGHSASTGRNTSRVPEWSTAAGAGRIRLRHDDRTRTDDLILSVPTQATRERLAADIRAILPAATVKERQYQVNVPLAALEPEVVDQLLALLDGPSSVEQRSL